jgi:hypothetical protein
VRGILNVPGSLQARLLQVLQENRAVFSAGVAATLLGSLGRNGAQRLGPVRPLAKTGPDMGGAELASAIARGFGLDQGQVSAVLATGPGAGGLDPSVTASQLPAELGKLSPADFAAARAGLSARVTSLVAQARLLAGETP